jgi:hypothetical protein
MEIAFPIPEEKEYELSNLRKGSQYQLYMRAVSRRGSSDPSDVLTVRTECKSSSDYVFYVSLVECISAGAGAPVKRQQSDSSKTGEGMESGMEEMDEERDEEERVWFFIHPFDQRGGQRMGNQKKREERGERGIT